MPSMKTINPPDPNTENFNITAPLKAEQIYNAKHRQHAKYRKNLLITRAILIILATAVPIALHITGHHILSTSIGAIAISWLIMSYIPCINHDIPKNIHHELAPAEPLTIQRIIDWSHHINTAVTKYRDMVEKQPRKVTNAELSDITKWIQEHPYTNAILHDSQ